MTAPQLPSDRQLLDAARRGDDAAWGELAQRHRMALEASIGTGRSARRVADAAMLAARPALEADEPETGVPAIRAVRPALIAAHTDGFYGPRWPGVLAAGDEHVPPAAGDDELLAVAFATLPEPWQTALWHHHVEHDDASAIAPYVGRSVNDVDELLATARRGLIDAFFREYERVGPFDESGAAIVSLLPGHHRGSLTTAERQVVAEHLRHDHIALAPPPDVPDAPPSPSAAQLAPPAGSLQPPDPALAPPILRRHDAVDSRRLLDLVNHLDQRLAPAIAPGVVRVAVGSDGEPTPVVAPGDEPDAQPDRRRLVALVGAVVVLVAVVAAAVFVRSALSGGDDVSAQQSDDRGDEVTADPAVSGDGAGEGDGDLPDDSAPTTLVLRPESLGPLNTISLSVDADAEPLGFAPTASEGISVVASSPAPVFAGGSGTIDLAVVNASGSDRTIGLGFTLPRGVRFGSATGATCVDPADGGPRCTVDLAADGAAAVSVQVLLDRSTVGRLEVEGDLVEPLVTPISVTPDLVHSSVGQGDVMVVGNTVTRCAPLAASRLDIDCDGVADGTGDLVNRWDVPIEFVGAASQFGLFNSSSAELTIPEGAEIVLAELYWSGDLEERGVSVPDDGRNTTIAFGLPGGEVSTIEAGTVVLGDVDASQYLGSNDVTELVRAGGSGRYTVGNVHTVEVQGSYGAWALVVVFDHPDEPRRHRLVTRPFEWVAPRDATGTRYEYGVDISVPPLDEATVQLDVVALEGELGFSPEQLLVGGRPLGADNPFDSSVRGDRAPAPDNSLGVDIDTYDLVIDASDGLLPIRATSERDGIRIAVLGLTVDVS